jgi:N-formylglutamate deformylase
VTRPPFDSFAPSAPPSALVVEVPHAGLHVPSAWAEPLAAGDRDVLRDADTFVDELVQDTTTRGAALLRANVSRYVVDLNRGRDEYDARAVAGARADVSLPHGLFWHTTAAGDRLLRRALSEAEAEERLRAVYDPYHAELERLVHERLDDHGIAVVLAVHSMPSHGANRAGHGRRADVVPGTQSFTTASPRLISVVEEWARAAGLSFSHDDPYRGGWVTKHWGRPRRRCHAIQLEFSRELYMNEVTLERRPEGIVRLRAACEELAVRLGEAAKALAKR